MAKAFFSIPTDVGVAALSNAMLLGNKVDITHIAVGDGNGSPYQPTANMLTLKRELWRGPVVKYEKEAEDVISISGIIPYNVGGFLIREMAVFDSGNNMIAIANTADLPKVTIDEGMSFDLHIKMRIHISNAEVIDVKINPHVTIATLEDVAKKTDKVAGGIVGNLTELDATGNLVDSGVSWEKINEQFRSVNEKKANGKWTFYNSLTEIGIIASNETIDSIVKAMVTPSTLETYIGSSNANIYPVAAGILRIEKVSDPSRTLVKFYSIDNSKEWNGIYYQPSTPQWNGWKLSTHEYQEISFELSANVIKKSMCSFAKDDIGHVTYNLGVEGANDVDITSGLLMTILPMGFFPKEGLSRPVVLEGASSTGIGRLTIDPTNGQIRIYHNSTGMKFAFGGGAYYAK